MVAPVSFLTDPSPAHPAIFGSATHRPHLYSCPQFHSSKQLERHYIHGPNWKMPGEQTTLLYGSFQSELKATDGPGRESFKAGFHHKKFAELLILSVQNAFQAWCSVRIYCKFQLRSISFTEIKLGTAGEIILSPHLPRQHKLTSRTRFFRYTGSSADCAVHYTQIIVLISQRQIRKLFALQSKSFQYSLF